jgi:hypothetical protein
MSEALYDLNFDTNVKRQTDLECMSFLTPLDFNQVPNGF